MERLSSTTLKIDFAKNPLGDYLSGHYTSVKENSSRMTEGLTIKLYVESGSNKWDVHAVSEIEANLDTEVLSLAGQVLVVDEEVLLEWFPEFASWLNQTLPRNFKLH